MDVVPLQWLAPSVLGQTPGDGARCSDIRGQSPPQTQEPQRGTRCIAASTATREELPA